MSIETPSSRLAEIARRIAVAAVALAIGCGRAPAPAAVTPRPALAPAATIDETLPTIGAAAARPEDVIAELWCGDPSAQLIQLALYADQVNNGAGVLASPERLLGLLGELVASPVALAGVDLGRPLQVVLTLDDVGAPAPVAVVAVADEPTLRKSLAGAAATRLIVHGGRAAIGSSAALRRAAPYALTTLAGAPDRGGLGGTFYGGARRGDAVAMSTLEMIVGAALVQGAGLAVADVDAALAAVRGVERVDLSLTFGSDTAAAAAIVRPRPGTALAGLVARQRPSDFGFVEGLRPGPWQLVLASQIDWGGAAPAIEGIVVPDSIFPPELWQAIAPQGWMGAAAREVGRPRLRLMVSGGGATAGERIASWARATAAQPLIRDGRITTVRPDALAARGARLHAVERGARPVKPVAQGVAEDGFVGVIGDTVVRGEGATGEAAAWLRAGHARADLGAAIEAGLAEARRAGDSAAVLVDLLPARRPPGRGVAPVPAQAAIRAGAGVAAGSLRLTLAVPAAQLAALIERP